MKPKFRIPESYGSDDYAALECENASFYYGYEVTENDEWCFTADFDDVHIRVPFSKLKAKDQWDCMDCLMMGIGWVLTKYKLTKKKAPSEDEAL